jgi:hypothetical protein
MIGLLRALFFRQRIETACTIEIAHTNESLHAHVALDEAGDLQPGDRVQVHGAAVQVPFGREITLRRPVTVFRAGAIEQRWVRFCAGFELCELYEVTFSSGRIP